MNKNNNTSIPTFARECLDAAIKPWKASFDHPFVRGLVEGDLPTKNFKFYQMQDARYLEGYAAACGIVSARCHDPADKLWFLDAARISLVTEGELHKNYGRKLGYDEASVAEMELTLYNRAYQDFIVAISQTGSMVEAVAALAPCPWLYIDLGRSMLAELGTIEDSHPYGDWLKLYSDPEFDVFSSELLQKLQKYADEATEDERKRAITAFVTATRYEWMFWEQAWTIQQWPV
ncbi:MAG: TenA family protein [Christensenellales bacterium]|jgi:thiaminase/transcriptional activator TenA